MGGRQVQGIRHDRLRIQEIPLLPQWMAQDWKVEVVSGGQTVELTSAQPHYETTAIPVTELDAVWVGRGSEADFLGRDVAGKAVFVETDQAIGNNGAVARPVQRARRSCSKYRCSQETCAIRAIPPVASKPASPWGMTTATPRGTSLKRRVARG